MISDLSLLESNILEVDLPENTEDEFLEAPLETVICYGKRAMLSNISIKTGFPGACVHGDILRLSRGARPSHFLSFSG